MISHVLWFSKQIQMSDYSQGMTCKCFSVPDDPTVLPVFITTQLEMGQYSQSVNTNEYKLTNQCDQLAQQE